jgi:hypothetical protein
MPSSSPTNTRLLKLSSSGNPLSMWLLIALQKGKNILVLEDTTPITFVNIGEHGPSEPKKEKT